MLSIIKVELFRLKKSVLFWVMLGITVALPLLGAVSSLTVFGVVDSADGGGNMKELLEMMGITSQYLNGMAGLSNWAIIFSIITTSIILSSEFIDGTMRNVLLANKSRSQLFFSYFITSIIVSVSYFMAYYAVTMLVIAPIFHFDGMSAGPAVSASLCGLAQGIVGIIFAEACVCMFLFSMRKQWAAILFPLLICLLLPYLILAFATLVLTTMALKGQITSLEAPLRWVPFANATIYNSADVDGVIVGMNIVYLAIFAVVFIVIGYYTFKKADLK